MSGRLTISLSALGQNYRTLRDSAHAEVACVVKANAYGLGVDTVVPHLAREGCRTFFVASLREARRVRELIDPESPARIFVLEGILSGEEVRHFIDSDLVPVVNHAQQLALVPPGYPYALHIDTGMERLGLPYADGYKLLEQGARPEIILSHLTSADDLASSTTSDQVAKISALRRFDIPLSLANSAGVLLHEIPEDIARTGIALYGGSPSGDCRDSLASVVKLEAPVLQVRSVPPGTPVGYGGAYRATEEEVLATVGIGYADGVPRLLSNRGHIWHERALSIVGRISMDMLHVRLAEGQVLVGDYVEIIGAHRETHIDTVAAHAQTLSYEVLTGLDAAGRLERIVVA